MVKKNYNLSFFAVKNYNKIALKLPDLKLYLLTLLQAFLSFIGYSVISKLE